jgi:hypothetical protein
MSKVLIQHPIASPVVHDPAGLFDTCPRFQRFLQVRGTFFPRRATNLHRSIAEDHIITKGVKFYAEQKIIFNSQNKVFKLKPF